MESEEALARTKELEIEQLNKQVSELTRQLEVARRLPQKYYAYMSGFQNAVARFQGAAQRDYGGEAWFDKLSPALRTLVGCGPLPADYGVDGWYVNNSITGGVPAYRCLFFEPGWDNEMRHHGHQIPGTAWPAWAYTFYDPDPPSPQYVRTGIVENLSTGRYPHSWRSNISILGATNFFKRLNVLFLALHQFAGQNIPPPPQEPGEPFGRASSGTPNSSFESLSERELSSPFAFVETQLPTSCSSATGKSCDGPLRSSYWATPAVLRGKPVTRSLVGRRRSV